jgi:Rps23 Pro-64 3,4-dihydroxylase Tpa1-like proline 4-hydroxylase
MINTLPLASEVEVVVILLLAGGHREMVRLRRDDPVLQSLISVKLRGDDAFFEIALEGGRRALYLNTSDIIAVITDPPLPRSLVAPEALLSVTLQLDDFLPADVHAKLVGYAIASQPRFITTSVDADVTDYRNSWVLHDFPEFASLMRAQVSARLPELRAHFGLDDFAVADIECQLTAHNDGHYYKVHNDNGSPATASRALSYVYYFHRDPKGFDGGALRMYDSRIENNYYVAADSHTDIAPRNNSIVFFLPRYLHEVMPIACASRAFADSRFTVNGWVRAAA